MLLWFIKQYYKTFKQSKFLMLREIWISLKIESFKKLIENNTKHAYQKFDELSNAFEYRLQCLFYLLNSRTHVPSANCIWMGKRICKHFPRNPHGWSFYQPCQQKSARLGRMHSPPTFRPAVRFARLGCNDGIIILASCSICTLVDVSILR